MESLVYFLPLFGVVGLIYKVILRSWVAKQDSGNEEMRGISDAIADGVMAFLKIAALQVFAKRLFIDHRYFNQL
jgi:K(+)-stimulated pyrophosphate-energized sodium pump